jgi:proline reductase-associated electron transfer protein PrdC
VAAVEISILLKQHVGGPCKPVVEVGQEVKKGELIAVPEGLGANIHASVYGKVTAINEAIVIELADEQPEEFVPIKETSSYVEAVAEAGIVGAGGAGFPAHVKFNTELNDGFVLVNAAECEPVLKHNIKLMNDTPELLIKGLKYAMEMTKAAKGYICIKPKHTQTMITLGKLIKEEPSIEIKFLPDMYPAGDERVIIREVLGVELEPGQLPSAANAVVSNVETLKNVALAIDERRPVITKDVTVGGRIKGNPDGVVYMDVPVGMPVGHYVELSGGLEANAGEIVIGGPFTGRSGSLETPVTKTTGGILASIVFPNDNRKFGILECECGAQADRLTEIVEAMGGTVVSSERCKRMVEVNGRYRCDKPGECPGQTEKVLALKKEGAQAIITGTCQD